jgi:hypothetical protein
MVNTTAIGLTNAHPGLVDARDKGDYHGLWNLALVLLLGSWLRIGWNGKTPDRLQGLRLRARRGDLRRLAPLKKWYSDHVERSIQNFEW